MKYVIAVSVFVFLAMGFFGSAMAQGGNGDDTGILRSDPVVIENPIEADNIQQLFAAIIEIALVFAIPIIVFFIIYAGFLYVTARGDTGTIQKAHMALLFAIIGGLLILGANVLIEVIQGTVDCVRGDIRCE